LVGLVVVPSAPALALCLLLLAGTAIAIAVDAWRTARGIDAAFQPRWYNRWYWYAATIVLADLVVQPRIKRVVEGTVAEAYRVPNASMAPTFQVGDYLLVSPLRGAPIRGEVVVYSTDTGPFFKRIVGIPGDTVAMANGKLLVNGRAVPEPHESREAADPVVPEFNWQRDYLAPGVNRSSYVASLHTWGPLVVPSGSYFVLGDNRSNSLDSRYTGFVPRASILARPVVIYFSWDDSIHAVRWHRIGLARPPSDARYH
jgi:signal peptidase I